MSYEILTTMFLPRNASGGMGTVIVWSPAERQTTYSSILLDFVRESLADGVTAVLSTTSGAVLNSSLIGVAWTDTKCAGCASSADL